MKREIDEYHIIESCIFESIQDALKFLTPWEGINELQGFIFRGHGDENFKLVPSTLRADFADDFWSISGNKPIDEQWKLETWQIQAELSILREFYRLADQCGLSVPLAERLRNNLAADFDPIGFLSLFKDEIWLPSDLYETAALAQHYGLPTRLLDWTYDLYVAFFFALDYSLKNKTNKIVIWCLNKEHLCFLKQTVSRKNIEFITPHYSNNPNLNAQKGLFTLWPVTHIPFISMIQSITSGINKETNRTSLDELLIHDIKMNPEPFFYFKKLIIPIADPVIASNYLTALGYHYGTMFPGYKGIADQICRRKYSKKT